jgi:hypothetical protein
MKKTGLLIFLVVVAIAAAVATPVRAEDWRDYDAEIARHRHQSRHSEMVYPNSGHYSHGYHPAVDPREAHRAYWDEGLVDEVGKIITLPFTLPMRVKSEWERLNTKATHWKKVRETYEKGFPTPKELTTP